MTLGYCQERREMKNHHNETWLREQVDLGKNSKQIANENRLSYKLVELYLRKFNIPFVPKERAHG